MDEKWGWSNREFAYQVRKTVRECINELDPIHLLSMDCPPDEYEPEIDHIVAKLVLCRAKPEVEALEALIHGIFVVMFDESMAGSPERYRSAAERIAALWDDRA